MGATASQAHTGNPLSELIGAANARRAPQANYQGEVTPVEAFTYIAEQGGLLVDVRTVPEWQFVGIPDVTGCKGTFAMISWKQYPNMDTNEQFAEELNETGVAKDAPIFFLCRGGSRSAAAAQAMQALGYSNCFNILTGFEGAADAEGHRGRVSGWQGAGLPWKH